MTDPARPDAPGPDAPRAGSETPGAGPGAPPTGGARGGDRLRRLGRAARRLGLVRGLVLLAVALALLDLLGARHGHHDIEDRLAFGLVTGFAFTVAAVALAKVLRAVATRPEEGRDG